MIFTNTHKNSKIENDINMMCVRVFVCLYLCVVCVERGSVFFNYNHSGGICIFTCYRIILLLYIIFKHGYMYISCTTVPSLEGQLSVTWNFKQHLCLYRTFLTFSSPKPWHGLLAPNTCKHYELLFPGCSSISNHIPYCIRLIKWFTYNSFIYWHCLQRYHLLHCHQGVM